jgi:hypothetical protein
MKDRYQWSRTEGREIMRRLLILVMGALLWVVMAVPASANGPAMRFTFDPTGDQFVCDGGAAVYEIVSGEIVVVVHEGSAAQGNANGTFTLTPRHIVANLVGDATDAYRIVGASWGGFTFNANTGGFVETFTDKFQIIESGGGGTVGTVNFTAHITAQPNNFVLNEFDFGNCSSPA